MADPSDRSGKFSDVIENASRVEVDPAAGFQTGPAADAGQGDAQPMSSDWQFIDGKWVYGQTDLTTGAGRDYVAPEPVQPPATDAVFGAGGRGTSSDELAAYGVGDQAFDTIDMATSGRAAMPSSQTPYSSDQTMAEAAASLLQSDPKASATSITQHGDSGDWTVTDFAGGKAMAQTIDTAPGDTYTLSFEVAANMSAGAQAGAVEVIWDGKVVSTVETSSGAFAMHQIQVPATAAQAELMFREVPVSDSDLVLNTDGPIASYAATMTLNGAPVDVAAFAPGQSKLYQMVDGQLKVFDKGSETYDDVGDPTGLGVNAIGFNVEDDMIYGIAKLDGTDTLGNVVSAKDLVMIDAEGNAYRIGETGVSDMSGDFDAEGNLWTFDSSANNVTKIDVDQLDAQGNPTVTEFDLPNELFGGRAYDVAYSAADDAFYAIQGPPENGAAGFVHKIDISGIETGDAPSIESLPIEATMYDDGMGVGMTRGTYGAAFFDGDGNLYYGLNRGDHDLDAETHASGGVYKVNMDWEGGTSHSEFMAPASATGNNDGAVDPRAPDPFANVDPDAGVLIRNPDMRPENHGDDIMRGSDLDDELDGGNGDDVLHGGLGKDTIEGGAGDDKAYGGDGDDILTGAAGNDNALGGTGSDYIAGGAGSDFIMGGEGADRIFGGAGVDRLIGGKGEDTIDGGAGEDHMWGGNWWADGAQDTFVVKAGGGKDMIHDFETDADVIDLSSYGVEFDDIAAAMSSTGEATEIDLSQLTGGEVNDKIIIKSVDPDDLDETNFIL